MPSPSVCPIKALKALINIQRRGAKFVGGTFKNQAAGAMHIELYLMPMPQQQRFAPPKNRNHPRLRIYQIPPLPRLNLTIRPSIAEGPREASRIYALESLRTLWGSGISTSRRTAVKLWGTYLNYQICDRVVSIVQSIRAAEITDLSPRSSTGTIQWP